MDSPSNRKKRKILNQIFQYLKSKLIHQAKIIKIKIILEKTILKGGSILEDQREESNYTTIGRNVIDNI